jgi:serine/threonine protein kinase
MTRRKKRKIVHFKEDSWDEDIAALTERKLLGQGSFGIVMVCLRDDASVEKRFKDSIPFTFENAETCLRKEEEFLQQCAGDLHIVQLSLTKPSHPLGLTMERCDMNAQEWFELQVNSEERWKAAKIMRIHILRALQSLEAKRILHLDVKPTNILVWENGKYPLFKLADFGNAVYLNDENEVVDCDYLQCGTYPFQAKEVLRMAHRYMSNTPLPHMDERLRFEANADMPGLALSIYYCVTLDRSFYLCDIRSDDGIGLIDHFLQMDYGIILNNLKELFPTKKDDVGIIKFLTTCLCAFPRPTPSHIKNVFA